MNDLELLESMVNEAETAWVNAVVRKATGRIVASLKRKLDKAYRDYGKLIKADC